MTREHCHIEQQTPQKHKPSLAESIPFKPQQPALYHAHASPTRTPTYHLNIQMTCSDHWLFLPSHAGVKVCGHCQGSEYPFFKINIKESEVGEPLMWLPPTPHNRCAEQLKNIHFNTISADTKRNTHFPTKKIMAPIRCTRRSTTRDCTCAHISPNYSKWCSTIPY